MEGGGARPEPERLLVDILFLPLDPFPLLLREEEDIFIPLPLLDKVLRVFTIQSIYWLVALKIKIFLETD